MQDHSANFVKWFRLSSPYINAHRGKTLVVMLPGDCIRHENFTNVTSDIALLHNLGLKVVVVHGARPQIDAQLQQRGMSWDFHRGLRITHREHLQPILEAVGASRFALEAAFSSGMPNSPMFKAKISVKGGNFVSAMPNGILDGVDLHLTGKVRNIDSQGIQSALDEGSLVVISPLGYSITGETFNLSFAEIGVSVATAIGADKLIAYNDDGPIMDQKGQTYRELTLLKCEKFLVEQSSNNLSNTYFALRACHRACDQGVARAHVVSSAEDGALLKELFTRDGSGTMIYRDHYETIRRARIEDVSGILNLIAPLEAEGLLVKRSRELLETEIQYFTVMEKDGLIIGCAALYPMGESKAGELACMAIHEDYRNSGRAGKLLTHIERQASRINLKQLYILTTQAAHWFISQGFVETPVGLLPSERQSLYNYQRNSKVFVKALPSDS